METLDIGVDSQPRGTQEVRGPLALDRDAAWLVTAGMLDVFVAARTASGDIGAKRHVYRLHAGSLLLGHPLAPAGVSLIAVPASGTTLLPVADAQPAALRRAAEQWSGEVAEALAARRPRDAAVLEADGDAAAGVAHAAPAPGWWLRLDGAAMLAGQPVADTDLFLPAQAWIITDPGARLSAPPGPPAYARCRAGLAALHRAAVDTAVQALAGAREDDRRRLLQKTHDLERRMSSSARRLAGVIDGERESSAGQAGEPLIDCFALVARHAGIALRLPAQAGELGTVEMLAEAAGVRVRQVALRGQWWRRDGGALLARTTDGAWAALLPAAGGKRYLLHAGGLAREVDETLAATLEPFAHCLYRPPPPGRMSLGSLARFALHGLGQDVRLLAELGLVLLALGLAAPVATGMMIDTVIPSAQPAQAWQLAGVLILIAATTTVLEFVRAVTLMRIETRMDGTMQAAMWDRVLRLPVPFFRRFAVGDLAMRLQSIEQLRRALSGGTIATLLGGAFSLGNFLLLVYYSGKLALAAAGCAALVLLCIGAIGFYKLRAERQVAEYNGLLSGKVIEYLAGIAKLRVAAAEARAFANWAELFAQARRLSFKAGKLGAADEVIFAAYPTLASALLFSMIGAAMAAGPAAPSLSTGQFVAFHAAFGTFLAGLASVGGTALGLLRLVPVAERAKPLLEAVPEVDPGKRHPGRLQGGIEVRGLRFRYGDGPDVLDGVDLSIAPGSFVAIVGQSGSGKSTLLRLLLGFEQPAAGVVTYDAQDLAELDVTAVRRQLGVVLQNGQLLSGSIYQNIVGARALPLEQAEEAARMCALEDDLAKMPMGMHTMISEGCSTLSGGQRQRILIARAIVHRPKILFFDEATSALDNRTQAQISRSLERINATRIVVAHRLSTVAGADEIIVMDRGRVVQRGTYAALMAVPGPFAELAKRQVA
jgi:ATP-binding cassette subfamily C protein